MHCLVLLFVDLLLISAASLAAISLAIVDVSSAAMPGLIAYCLVTLVASVPVLLLFRLNPNRLALHVVE
jgi:hypothetical protein